TARVADRQGADPLAWSRTERARRRPLPSEHRARCDMPRAAREFVECPRTLQIGHADTDVVESLHHVRWLRLLLRPVAKTSESGPTRRKPLLLFRPLKSSRSHLRRS